MLTPEEREEMFKDSQCIYCMADDGQPHSMECPLFSPLDTPSELICNPRLSPNGTYYLAHLTGGPNWPWGFAETIGRLLNFQRNQSNGGEKVAVEFIGTYRGDIFTLYDYKGDFELHIGGQGSLDVSGLMMDLKEILSNVKPKRFSFPIPEDYCEDNLNTIDYPPKGCS